MIKALRYSAGEYFWINDLSTPVPRMVMHPTVPSLDGVLLDAAKFNCATSLQEGIDGPVIQTNGAMNLFVAANTVATKSGQGYVTYLWPKPLPDGRGVTRELFPKMSYVKKFGPWGWIVGSGIYTDDVDAAYRKMVWSSGLVVLLLGALQLSLSTFIARGIARPIIDAARTMSEIEATGDLRRRLPETGGQETVVIARAFNRLVVDQSEKTDAILLRLQTSMDALEKANEEMAAIFESLTFGIAFIKDRVMVKANRKLEELFGYDPGELCGQPTRCWYPTTRVTLPSAKRTATCARRHRSARHEMRRKDGTLFWSSAERSRSFRRPGARFGVDRRRHYRRT